MTRDAGLIALLIVMGAGWGLTQPMAKLAVSTGYQPMGLIFWQMVIGAAVLVPLVWRSGRRLVWSGPALRVYVTIALIGTVLPSAASFKAMAHLPSGVISILLSLVPMLAFPVALSLGNERFRFLRLAGLALGLIGVMIIVLPDASLPDPAMVFWVPLGLVAPMFYALEGNVVARWGTAGLGAVDVLAGASLVGVALSLPIAVALGQFIDPRSPWGIAEFGLVVSSLVHAGVYTGYVWLVSRAGAVFAVQVSYLVTGFGVLWAVALLGERYSGYIWAAMALMLVGMFLVQPRPGETRDD